ncbi:30S ribosomal protein S7 [Candidatus Woesearchaeota archaeon]|nr:30S ribosomal protein S7 [Candidatus Woesearchaeota archaeon]
MVNFKLFNKWDISDIEVQDPGLKGYVSIYSVLVPRNAGRNAKNRFWKSKTHIVERLMNKLQVTGHKGKKHYRTSSHLTGKWNHTYKIVQDTFGILEKQTKENPMKVFVKALENAAPREEITTIEYGGARYPQAVDCSPQRRIDIALRQMTQGAYSKSFGKKKKIHEALADEILFAYNVDQSSQAISKKLELERQADSSR